MEAVEMRILDTSKSYRVGGRYKKIMVVEDEAFIRKLVSMIAKKEGYEVIEAGNGKDAAEKLLDTQIDLLITDLNMPEMDGIELVRTLRSRPGQMYTPVIMLSSEFREARRQMAYEAGINEWVPKPFITKHLRDLITKYDPEPIADGL